MERKLIYESKGKRFFAFAFFGIAFVFLGGLVVMFLWNAILPAAINGANKLNYWQSIGLLILSKILFGGFRGKPGGGPRGFGNQQWREKLKQMTPEEREKFRTEWRERCGRTWSNKSTE
jgi:hypothetical protein